MGNGKLSGKPVEMLKGGVTLHWTIQGGVVILVVMSCQGDQNKLHFGESLSSRTCPLTIALIFISGTYSFRVYCVIGDAESAEGSVWEALNFASYYKLGNLCAIFDINRLGQSDPTMLQHDFETYKKRTEAFG